MPTKTNKRGGKAALSDALAEANGDAAPPDEVVVAPTLAQAVLEANRPAGAWSGAEAASLDPATLDPDPLNPRSNVGDLDELVASVIALGVLEPLIVCPGPADGRYTIVAGHRRWAAATRANLAEVPALIRKDLIPSSNLSLAAQLAENVLREPLTPIEEARVYLMLSKDLGMKQTDIAEAVGVNQGTVSKRLALLKLPEDVQAKVDTGELEVATAVELTKLPDKARKGALAEVARGGTADAAIRRARAEAERVKRHAAVEDDIERRKVAVVDFPATWSWHGREERPLVTGIDGEPQRYGSGRTIDVTYADHESEPCHGAAVSPHDEVVYLCLDPTRHGYPTLEQEDAERDAERTRAEAERLEAAALVEAALNRRRDAAKAAAVAKLAKPDLVDYLARWVASGLITDDDTVAVLVEEPERHTLLEWLGIDPDLEAEDAGAGDVANLIAAEGHLRIAYMTALAVGMRLVDSLSSSYHRQAFAGHPAVRLHLEHLAQVTDYELTDDDRTLLEAPVDDDDVVDLTIVNRDAAPDGAVAWYKPAGDDDEARWVDQAEADAITSSGAGERLAWLAAMPSLELDATDADDDASSGPGEQGPENAPASDAPDPAAEPAAAEATPTGNDGDVAARFLEQAKDLPDGAIGSWGGHLVIPGEKCPASRRDVNLPGSATGIECPACKGPIDTTERGRPKDHTVAALEVAAG